MRSRSPTVLTGRSSGEGAPRRCSAGLPAQLRGLHRCAAESTLSHPWTPCWGDRKGLNWGQSLWTELFPDLLPRSNRDFSACKSLNCIWKCRQSLLPLHLVEMKFLFDTQCSSMIMHSRNIRLDEHPGRVIAPCPSSLIQSFHLPRHNTSPHFMEPNSEGHA